MMRIVQKSMLVELTSRPTMHWYAWRVHNLPLLYGHNCQNPEVSCSYLSLNATFNFQRGTILALPDKHRYWYDPTLWNTIQDKIRSLWHMCLSPTHNTFSSWPHSWIDVRETNIKCNQSSQLCQSQSRINSRSCRWAIPCGNKEIVVLMLELRNSTGIALHC